MLEELRRQRFGIPETASGAFCILFSIGAPIVDGHDFTCGSIRMSQSFPTQVELTLVKSAWGPHARWRLSQHWYPRRMAVTRIASSPSFQRSILRDRRDLTHFVPEELRPASSRSRPTRSGPDRQACATAIDSRKRSTASRLSEDAVSSSATRRCRRRIKCSLWLSTTIWTSLERSATLSMTSAKPLCTAGWRWISGCSINTVEPSGT